MYKKSITIEQFKDAMRYTFGEQYNMTDLSDWDNWNGFTLFLHQAWKNLDKRVARKRKIELRKEPPRFKPYVRLPIVGQLYRRDN